MGAPRLAPLAPLPLLPLALLAPRPPAGRRRAGQAAKPQAARSTAAPPRFTPPCPLAPCPCPLPRDAAANGFNRISPVKQQGLCNSCTAFSTLAAAEAAVASAMRTNNTFDFSEQDLYFCNAPKGSCPNGWYFSDAIRVLTKSGVVSEACVPYNAMGASGGPKACAWQEPCVPAFPLQGGFQVAQLATVAQMQAHIVEHGVVVTALTVYMDYLKHWASGTDAPYRCGGAAWAAAAAAAAELGHAGARGRPGGRNRPGPGWAVCVARGG